MGTSESARAARRQSAFLRGITLALAVAFVAGCATKADLYKLEERVIDSQRAENSGPNPFERIADLSLEIEALRDEQRRLEGQLEVAQKTADDALQESRKAREALALMSAASAADESIATAAGAGEVAADALGISGEGHGNATTSAEVIAYQAALTAWRNEDHEVCIDLFRKFLQTYPASPYADDAAYWMADCHFKNGDYRVAVLRFNDVVRVYPNGNKASDALYRQGESLLKLGPGFYDAARTVFKQVMKEYPESERAREARHQLEAIGTG